MFLEHGLMYTAKNSNDSGSGYAVNEFNWQTGSIVRRITGFKGKVFSFGVERNSFIAFGISSTPEMTLHQVDLRRAVVINTKKLTYTPVQMVVRPIGIYALERANNFYGINLHYSTSMLEYKDFSIDEDIDVNQKDVLSVDVAEGYAYVMGQSKKSGKSKLVMYSIQSAEKVDELYSTLQLVLQKSRLYLYSSIVLQVTSFWKWASFDKEKENKQLFWFLFQNTQIGFIIENWTLFTITLEFPFCVAKRADVSGFEPAWNTVEVESMIANTPSDGAFFACSRLLVSLAFNAQVHNMISANSASIDNDICYFCLRRDQMVGSHFLNYYSYY